MYITYIYIYIMIKIWVNISFGKTNAAKIEALPNIYR